MDENKILKYELYIDRNDDTILEDGLYKNLTFKTVFINSPIYVDFICNNNIKKSNLKNIKMLYILWIKEHLVG